MNQTQYISVKADTLEGYNTTVQSRLLQDKLDEYAASADMPEGCWFSLGGESDTVNYMVQEMVQWMALALPFVYLVMVAQFQSLLSPFIVLFTIPLAFTGGMLGLMAAGEQLSLISLMGFLVLMGRRRQQRHCVCGLRQPTAHRAAGAHRRPCGDGTRMRPILMTTLTTVLARSRCCSAPTWPAR